jgi:hypothetical protein
VRSLDEHLGRVLDAAVRPETGKNRGCDLIVATPVSHLEEPDRFAEILHTYLEAFSAAAAPTRPH